MSPEYLKFRQTCILWAARRNDTLIKMEFGKHTYLLVQSRVIRKVLKGCAYGSLGGPEFEIWDVYVPISFPATRRCLLFLFDYFFHEQND